MLMVRESAAQATQRDSFAAHNIDGEAGATTTTAVMTSDLLRLTSPSDVHYPGYVNTGSHMKLIR